MAVWPATGRPARSQKPRNSEWEAKRIPEASPNEWQSMASCRDPVIFGSFWRSEPEAALRGLA